MRASFDRIYKIMQKLNLAKLQKMFAAAAADITAAEKDLSALDAVCGDGDHGTAIKGAINAANDAIAAAGDLKGAFFDAGFASMSHSNGSTSTLFGSLLMGISDGIDAGAEELGAEEVAKAFKSGLDSVMSNTGAKVGDKTLMDALIPAVESMQGKTDLAELFNSAAAAAAAGAESTVKLQAKFGRARNLGEKSVGSKDAGAVSDAMIFAAFAREFSKP